MKLNRWILAGGLAVTSVASAANDTNDAVDTMNAVSQKGLMRTGKVSFSGIEKKEIYDFLPFDRFEVLDGAALNSAGARDWCKTAVNDMQKSRGNVDSKTGESRVTAEAVTEACGNSFGHDATVTVNCRIEVKQTFLDKITQKAPHPYGVCDSVGKFTFRHYKASVTGSDVNFASDDAFGTKGEAVVEAKDDTSIAVNTDPKNKSNNPQQDAIDAARLMSTTLLKLKLKRQMLEVKAFQVHAPIAGMKGGDLKTCISKEVGYRDLPVFVLVETDKGEQQVGFAKVRELSDGCTLTDKLADAQKKGKKVAVGPSNAQLILGGSKVKSGMTLWEMPSLGLNVGLGGGFRTQSLGSADPAAGFGGRLDVEYSLSSKIPVNELFAHADLDVGTRGEQSLMTFGGGLIKRAYFAGPFFADAQADFQMVGESTNEANVSLSGMGVSGNLGLGAQLSPRLLLRARVGYGVYSLQAYAKASESSDPVAVGDPQSLTGPEAGAALLYNL